MFILIVHNKNHVQQKKRTYLGEGISIFYNPLLCGHISTCIRGLAEVFNSEKSP
ncbi:MAG: (4Fe-4S)-binding protein [Culicoidibacterales bacterium]